MGLLAALLLAAAGSGDTWSAIVSVYSNCDCSGESKAEHTVPVCAPTGIVGVHAVQVACAPDGRSVTIRTFKGNACPAGEEPSNTTYPVGQCLPVPEPNGYVHLMNRFQCVKSYAPRNGSIVGKQYAGSTCGAADGGPVLAEANYVGGCFPSCEPPSTSNPFPNLWQVADSQSLAGAYCNGTGTDACSGQCLPDGQVTVGECQVLGHGSQKEFSIKYSYWQAS